MKGKNEELRDSYQYRKKGCYKTMRFCNSPYGMEVQDYEFYATGV